MMFQGGEGGHYEGEALGPDAACSLRSRSRAQHHCRHRGDASRDVVPGDVWRGHSQRSGATEEPAEPGQPCQQLGSLQTGQNFSLSLALFLFFSFFPSCFSIFFYFCSLFLQKFVLVSVNEN